MERVERDYMGIGKSVRWVTSWEGRGRVGLGRGEGGMDDEYVPFCWWFEYFVGWWAWYCWTLACGRQRERESDSIGTVRYEVLNPDDGST